MLAVKGKGGYVGQGYTEAEVCSGGEIIRTVK